MTFSSDILMYIKFGLWNPHPQVCFWHYLEKKITERFLLLKIKDLHLILIYTISHFVRQVALIPNNDIFNFVLF